MNEQTFCFWLQGFVELSDTDTISEKQWLMIKDHLKLVFDKKTPDRQVQGEPINWDVVRPKPVDLIGQPGGANYWQYPYSPVITC